MPRYVEGAVTVILVACALTVAAMALRNQIRQPTSRGERVRLAGWEPLAREGHRLGSDAARVVIVEFADFQCSACERVRFALDTVRWRFGGDVALVYRHYPLRMTRVHSDSAANAAECAADQGRFFEFAAALYDRQNHIGRIPWSDFAIASGVPDVRRFEDCIKSAQFRPRVERDVWVGDSIGIFGTPTLIVNGVVITGAVRARDLEGEVQAFLKDSSPR